MARSFAAIAPAMTTARRIAEDGAHDVQAFRVCQARTYERP